MHLYKNELRSFSRESKNVFVSSIKYINKNHANHVFYNFKFHSFVFFLNLRSKQQILTRQKMDVLYILLKMPLKIFQWVLTPQQARLSSLQCRATRKSKSSSKYSEVVAKEIFEILLMSHFCGVWMDLSYFHNEGCFNFLWLFCFQSVALCGCRTLFILYSTFPRCRVETQVNKVSISICFYKLYLWLEQFGVFFTGIKKCLTNKNLISEF